METCRVRVETGTREHIAIISPTDSSTAKTLSVLQPPSLQTGGNVEGCSPEPAAVLPPAAVECLHSSGSEGIESAFDAHKAEKLEISSKSGYEEMAQISDGALSWILGELEAPPIVSPQRRCRKRPIQIVDVSVGGPSEVGISGVQTSSKLCYPYTVNEG